MQLIEPRSAEYANINELRKYPFSDSASMTNGQAIIVPNAIIDAQLYIPTNTQGRVWLSKITPSGLLQFSTSAGVVAETTDVAIANTAVPVTFTGELGTCYGGVIVFGTNEGVRQLMSLCGQEFKENETELSPAAVTYTGLSGVVGFKLDDGNIITGDVRFRGENGCIVSTYVDSTGKSRFVISAIGKSATAAETGFITSVELITDNRHFTIGLSEFSTQLVNICGTGIQMLDKEGFAVDQDTICAQMRKARGTAITPTDKHPQCPVCEPWTVKPIEVSTAPEITEQAPLQETRVVVTFENYGTLHLAAPDAEGYINPITISGNESPLPVINVNPTEALSNAAQDMINKIVVNPVTQAGEVVFGIRGLNKAIDL